MFGKKDSVDKGLPFGLTRFLSWISLILILASSVMLAFFIGNSARNTLLLRQQQYAMLMASNLNQQIYRRFTLPTFLAFGRIALRQSMQYQQLDDVVQSTILGLHLESLRIYGADRVVNYSINQMELGRTDITPASMERVMSSGIPFFETLSSVNMLSAMFMLKIPDGSYSLRTMFPLTVDLGISESTGKPESLVTGVLEITQDITDDYDSVVRFQWLILATCLGSSTILFAILQFFIIKAERTLAERMSRNRKLEAELHQNEKLASMGRVIASIAHEIRNPLGIIRSSSEFLIRRTPEQEKGSPAQRILTAIFDESCRLSQIVNDFLDYARPRVPRQDRVDLNALLNQATGFLDGEMKRLGVECVRDTEGSLFVLGDKELLYRGRLQHPGQRLSGHRDQRDHPYPRRTPGRRHDRALVPRQRPRFPARPAAQASRSLLHHQRSRHGPRPAIVNTIITSHNGKLLLTNPEDGGAMITILLPVASEPDIGDTPEKDERPAASADDEPVTLTDPLPSEKHDLREGDASPQTR